MIQHHQSLLDSISAGLSEALGGHFQLEWVRNLHGGDINHAALVRWGSTDCFVKYHASAPPGMFAAEAQALTELSDMGRIKVPRPITTGNDGTTDWLVLEYIELNTSGSAAQLGEDLAALHHVTREQYGWRLNNYIGTTPQINTPCDCWSDFWRDFRLKPQLEMATAVGHRGRLPDMGERLLANMDRLMDGHQPPASLLHGDLWGGNKAFTMGGTPIIFDPASYYGDRETDIAMTELFGGFGSEFYSAYQANLPLADGYRMRRDLYNLYHMLNHLNLFGGAYLSRCQSMIERLLVQVD